MNLSPLFMLPGGPEMLVILLIVVLLFGANKLPKLARASGQAMGEFQRGRAEIERELRASAGDEVDESRVDDENRVDYTTDTVLPVESPTTDTIPTVGDAGTPAK